MDREKMLSIAGLVLVVGAVVGYSIFDLGKSTKPAVTKAPESVATVNGVAIPETDYETQVSNVLSSLKNQGVDVSTPDKVKAVRVQVLNDFIGNELVNQEIAKAGIKATDADVQAQFDAIQKQAGGADNLKAEMAKANLTEAQLRANIAKQLAVQAYILKNVDLSKVTVSDAEVAEFYKNYTAGKTGVPSLKDLTAQIKQQITTNKQQALVAEFVAKLRANAKVETKLK